MVGPEGPLAAGIVDFVRERGLRIFGPTKAAAQLESSKAHAKAFMARHQIPTASYAAFTDAAAAHAHVDAHGAPIVIKADGLAAGKGVVVATTLAQAHEAIDWMLGTDGAPNTLGVQHNAGADGQAQPFAGLDDVVAEVAVTRQPDAPGHHDQFAAEAAEVLIGSPGCPGPLLDVQMIAVLPLLPRFTISTP